MRHDPIQCGYGLPDVEEVLARLRARAVPVTQTQTIQLCDAVGRVSSMDIRAQLASPPHDNSAMDGFSFAHGWKDALALIGSASAGRAYGGHVAMGQCVRIATGAMIPAGCDTVIPVEQCKDLGERVCVLDWPEKGAHVRKRGEDFAPGDILVPANTRLQPLHIGLVASAGICELSVRRRLRIAVGSTGNELCDVSGALHPDRIFNSNRPMLLAFCSVLGAEVTDLGTLPDNVETIGLALAGAADHDAIILTGGTSAGQDDLLQPAIRAAQGAAFVTGVAIRPGKPATFGSIGRAILVGLPGNPVAAAIAFLVLACPLLRQLAGESWRLPAWTGVRIGFAHRKKRGVREYLRVCVSPGPDGLLRADLLAKQGSAILTSLAGADGLLQLGEDLCEVGPGTILPYCSFGQLIVP